MNNEASIRTGVLIPVPCHPTTVLSITGLGAVTVPYYLNEEQGWELQVEELQRALESAKGVCNPVALYVINPGNPSGGEKNKSKSFKYIFCIKEYISHGCYRAVSHIGHVQSRKSMQEVIRFVSEKRLFLLADEVGVLKHYYLSMHMFTAN